MFPSRRFLLAVPAAFAAAAAAQAQTAPPADLATAGPLGEMALGPAEAKVTVIEYASLTCSHCATFHNGAYPEFKAKYVDTGKVRFIFREFPLDPLAMAGFMLSRCAGEGKYHAMLDMLFKQQRVWAFAEKPAQALLDAVRQAGFTQESFDACLKRDDIYAGLNDVKNRAAQKLGVDSTPTFFINGQKHVGALTIQELDKILAPLIGG
jgi:protein-disulfide isomerase